MFKFIDLLILITSIFFSYIVVIIFDSKFLEFDNWSNEVINNYFTLVIQSCMWLCLIYKFTKNNIFKL